MNLSCDIIRDLLPLYVDEVCSEESRTAVEAHLQSCAQCREELRVMRCGETAAIAEEVNTAKAAGKLWKKSKLRSMLLGLLIAAALFGVAYALTVPNILPVNEKYLKVEDVYHYYDDGTFKVKLTILDGMKHNYIRYRQVGDAFYITPMRPVITTREDPDWVEKKNTGTHTIGGAVVGNALYVGWGDDAILVWSSEWEDENSSDLYKQLEEQVRQ